ncbi:hypothetical protein D3C76_1447420 [compost metagenome]
MDERRSLGMSVDIEGFRYNGSIPIQSHVEEKLGDINSPDGCWFEHKGCGSISQLFKATDNDAVRILLCPGGVGQCLAYRRNRRLNFADKTGVDAVDPKKQSQEMIQPRARKWLSLELFEVVKGVG